MQTAQKTIGILGGASDVATMEYYKFLNSAVNQARGGWTIAETLIAGMDFGIIEDCVRTENWPALDAYLGEKIDSLVKGGADLIVCVSNTLHRSLPQLMQNAPIPLIHIADPTGMAINAQGLQTIGLFGTRPIMEADYMRRVYEEKHDINIITPNPAEIGDIDRVIFDELVKGKLETQSKKRFIQIAKRLQAEHQIEGLILGCTEIFLLIEDGDIEGLPFFNTAKLHCEAAARFVLERS